MTVLQPEDNDDMVKRLGRVGAFAPGGYYCECLACKVMFVGDKRALNCLPCAVAALAPHKGAETQLLAESASYPDPRDARIAALTEALEVTMQAVREVSHAEERGVRWYTNGESGLRQQIRRHVTRGVYVLHEPKKLGLNIARLVTILTVAAARAHVGESRLGKRDRNMVGGSMVKSIAGFLRRHNSSKFSAFESLTQDEQEQIRAAARRAAARLREMGQLDVEYDAQREIRERVDAA